MLGGFATTIRVFTDEEIRSGDKLFFKDGKAIQMETTNPKHEWLATAIKNSKDGTVLVSICPFDLQFVDFSVSGINDGLIIDC